MIQQYACNVIQRLTPKVYFRSKFSFEIAQNVWAEQLQLSSELVKQNVKCSMKGKYKKSKRKK